MADESGPVVVLCKWRAEMVPAILDVTANLYVVLDESDLARADFGEGLLDGVRGVYRIGNFDSVEEVTGVAVDLAVRGIRVSRVISLSEDSQLGANHLRTLLGCATADGLVLAGARDKRMMKELVGRAGVPVTRWASLPSGGTDFGAVAFPAVVKPAFGFGTMNTIRVDGPEDAATAVRQLPRLPRLKSDHLIIEEFINGRELHIDALWHDGEPLFFLVSSYYVPRLTHVEGDSGSGGGSTRDGSYLIQRHDHLDLYDRLSTLHSAVNRALGIATAVTHLEVFETDSGDIVFSEVATRMGGGYIPDMLSAQLGYNVYDALASGLINGRIVDPKPAHRHVGALHLRPSRAGIISSMPSDAEIQEVDGVVSWRRMKQAGDTIGFANAMDWCLVVVIGADDAQAYSEFAERVEAQLVIEVE